MSTAKLAQHTADQTLIKGVIFDLDGVLVDTVPAHYRAWNRMFAEHGYAFNEQIYRERVDGRLRFDLSLIHI